MPFPTAPTLSSPRVKLRRTRLALAVVLPLLAILGVFGALHNSGIENADPHALSSAPVAQAAFAHSPTGEATNFATELSVIPEGLLTALCCLVALILLTALVIRRESPTRPRKVNLHCEVGRVEWSRELTANLSSVSGTGVVLRI